MRFTLSHRGATEKGGWKKKNEAVVHATLQEDLMIVVPLLGAKELAYKAPMAAPWILPEYNGADLDVHGSET